MEKKFKGLVAIQDVLDDRYQKLSDKYHNLELSHNRKKKTLQLCLKFCEVVEHTHWDFYFGELCYPVLVDLIHSMHRSIESALFCDGRERERKCTTQKKDSKSCLKESKKKNSNK